MVGYHQKEVQQNMRKKIAKALLYEREFTRNTRGDFTTKSSQTAIDYFKVELPNDFYQEYLKKRKEKELDLLAQIKASLSKTDVKSDAI